MNKTIAPKDFWESILEVLRHGGSRSLPLVAVLWLLTAGSQVTKAQTGQRPFVAPEPVELGFVESATGDLHLEFPFGSFPQRASNQPTTYRLVYDSNFWTISPSKVWQPSGFPVNGSWQTVTTLYKSITYTTTTIIAHCPTTYSNFTYDDPAGIIRVFPITTTNVT